MIRYTSNGQARMRRSPSKGSKIELSANLVRATLYDIAISEIPGMNNFVYDLQYHALLDPGCEQEIPKGQ